MDKKEKTAQIKASIEKHEGPELTEQEEYTIIAGKGIKYVTAGGMELYIPQIALYDMDLMYAIDKAIEEKTIREVFKTKRDVFAELTNTNKEDWDKKGMVTLEDLDNIQDIINYVIVHRKKLFEKKTISKKAIHESVISKLTSALEKTTSLPTSTNS